MTKAQKHILLIYGFSMLGSALPAALFYFYVRDVLNASAYLIHFLAVYIFAGLVMLPLWKKATQRFDAAQVWQWAMIYTVAAFSGVCFLGANDVIPYAILCALSGISFGAEYMLPAMVLKNARSEGENARSAPYGKMVFVTYAAALAGCAPLLLFTGAVSLPPSYQHAALIALYGWVPCLLKAMAAFLLWQWIKKGGDGNEKSFTRGDAHAA